jgi:hypothetical protein
MQTFLFFFQWFRKKAKGEKKKTIALRCAGPVYGERHVAEGVANGGQ